MATIITKITEIEIGDFIKYSDRDTTGAFNYVGEVILVDVDKEVFEMLTLIGELGFSFIKEVQQSNANPFSSAKTVEEINHQKLEKVSTKPKGWAKYKKNPEKFLADKIKANTIPPIRTKKQQVFDLVENNPRKKLNGLLTLAKKQIGGNPATLKAQIQLALARKK